MAVVSLQSLLGADIQGLDNPAVVEGLFTLTSSNHSHHPPALDSDTPAVGVSVSIKEEQHAAGVSSVERASSAAQTQGRQVHQLL